MLHGCFPPICGRKKVTYCYTPVVSYPVLFKICNNGTSIPCVIAMLFSGIEVSFGHRISKTSKQSIELTICACCSNSAVTSLDGSFSLLARISISKLVPPEQWSDFVLAEEASCCFSEAIASCNSSHSHIWHGDGFKCYNWAICSQWSYNQEKMKITWN